MEIIDEDSAQIFTSGDLDIVKEWHSLSTVDIDALTDGPGRPLTNDHDIAVIFSFYRFSQMNTIEVSYCNRSWLRVWIDSMMMDAMKYRPVIMPDVCTSCSHLRVPLNHHQHCEPLATHRQRSNSPWGILEFPVLLDLPFDDGHALVRCNEALSSQSPTGASGRAIP